MKENNFVPIDVYNFAQLSGGNVYKSLVITSKRANQLTTELKEELTRRLSEFAPSYDNLEEVAENKEQEDISKIYERKPKTTQVALEEYIAEKIYWREP
ncbi:MAG: DNA-directed RNA polymerase subunit omega [Bacteroidia bacterium]|nr:DNA-directed RNA polymerase subunit omega [Bacteroidia bacterium]